MLKILFSVSLILSSFTSFAELHDSEEDIELVQPAGDEQKAFLCLEVTKMLASEEIDAAIDFMDCLHNREIVTEAVGGGVLATKGPLKFRAPGRPPYDVTCTVYSEDFLVKLEESEVECSE